MYNISKLINYKFIKSYYIYIYINYYKSNK